MRKRSALRVLSLVPLAALPIFSALGLAQVTDQAQETLGCSNEQTREVARAGFDYVFNNAEWRDLHGDWLLNAYNALREDARSISFPESHDTQRLFEEACGNADVIKQRDLFDALFSAGVMIPMGFEFGARKPLHAARTSPKDWEEPVVDFQPYIKRVNEIKRQHPVFREESPTRFLG